MKTNGNDRKQEWKPEENPWYQEAERIWSALENREPFRFDPGSDGLYQQYLAQAQALGARAMQDTMGSAAGLTGGYGSSYGQRVGQEAYEGYLSQLNERVPELYAQERAQYDREGQALLQRLETARAFYDGDYRQYADEQDRAADAQDRADDAQQYADEQGWKERDYAYDTAVLMLENGILPSAALLAAAGIPAEDAAQMQRYFAALAAAGRRPV